MLLSTLMKMTMVELTLLVQAGQVMLSSLSPVTVAACFEVADAIFRIWIASLASKREAAFDKRGKKHLRSSERKNASLSQGKSDINLKLADDQVES